MTTTSAAGYENYQQWLAGTRLEQRGHDYAFGVLRCMS